MKKISLFLLIFVFAFSVYAQDKPDFSGTWTIDEGKSQIPQMGNRRMPLPEKLVITQKGANIKIETVRTIREEERKSDMELEIGAKEKKIESQMFGRRPDDAQGEPPVTMAQANWDKDGKSLVVIENTTGNFNGQAFSMKSTSTYSLSDKGNTLTVHNLRTSRRGDRESTLVYSKSK